MAHSGQYYDSATKLTYSINTVAPQRPTSPQWHHGTTTVPPRCHYNARITTAPPHHLARNSLGPQSGADVDDAEPGTRQSATTGTTTGRPQCYHSQCHQNGHSATRMTIEQQNYHHSDHRPHPQRHRSNLAATLTTVLPQAERQCSQWHYSDHSFPTVVPAPQRP